MKKKLKNEISPEIQNTLVEIGKKVRDLRRQKNRNNETFCSENNFNKVTLANVENGINYKMDTFLRLLKILDINVNEFFKDI